MVLCTTMSLKLLEALLFLLIVGNFAFLAWLLAYVVVVGSCVVILDMCCGIKVFQFGYCEELGGLAHAGGWGCNYSWWLLDGGNTFVDT